MTTTTRATNLPEGLDCLPPTEDDLPYSDGMPMESQQHVLQMQLLASTLQRAWAGRDVFIGENMFVYFSPDQVKTHDFRGPDVFVALGVDPRPRKSWVVWQEDGKGPDVVIELLSDSTAAVDKGEKLAVYRDRLRVPEYFWFHPLTGEFDGHTLRDGRYHPIPAGPLGERASARLGLTLIPWDGEYAGVQNRWLRWADAGGALLPTPNEAEVTERLRAAWERQRAEQERERAEHEAARATELEAMLARYRERFGELRE